jgi:hypothetical protein
MAEPPVVDPRLSAMRKTFPNGRSLVFTSPRTQTHTCIAYAMGDEARVWWPIGFGDPYWPPGVHRALTRTSFHDAFWTMGYRPCADGALVEGIEKVCLYEKNQKPTHAARQLPSGRWRSKIGSDEDIEHTLEDLIGRVYGRPVAFFARPRPLVVGLDAAR